MEKWKKSEFQNTCVKIEHVTKRFGEDLVLKEVNLTLKVGQVYGVVGNNGSGKTVLMKCICGIPSCYHRHHPCIRKRNRS